MTEELGYAEAVACLTAPGQLFELEEIDIRGVRMRSWKAAPPSLRTLLESSLGYGDADFIVYEDTRISYARHYRIAATLAHRLTEDLGVRKGDHVAIAMRNLPEWVMAFWGAIAAGAIVVPLNAWWTGAQLAHGLADSGSVVAFVDEERAERIGPYRGELESLRAVVKVGDQARTTADGTTPGGPTPDTPTLTFAELLGDVDDDARLPDVPILPDDDATILYTSGTTGRPKGAVGTHRNICTNLMNIAFYQVMSPLRWGARPTVPGDATQRCCLLSVPLFHVTGCHAVLVSNIASGTRLVLMHHFDPERALELIEHEKVTVFVGVPALAMQVLDSPDLARRDVSSIRTVSYGGAPAPAWLVERIRAAFSAGQAVNGYGLTETSAATAVNFGEDYVRKPDSVGRAVPIADVAIVPDGFTGSEPPELPPGTFGELWVKGPHVVKGYWKHPEDSARAITAGWLHTGDIARIDEEAFIFIVDRAKDVVIRGGENVYSIEVEDALFSHPAVADCAVIGVPHAVLGEEVGAVVVLRPGQKVTADELADHVRRRLAAFNVPTRLWFRSRPLPRTREGKVLKRALRTELRDAAAPGTDPRADHDAAPGAPPPKGATTAPNE